MATSAKASTPKTRSQTASAPREATVKTTPARNTNVPPKAKAGAKASAVIEITREMIAERAYHLWRTGAPGGELDHWCAAERELNGK